MQFARKRGFNMTVWKAIIYACLLGLLAAVGSLPAAEQAVLHIGPGALTGLLCSDGVTDAALGCGVHPNPVPSDHLDVFANSGGMSSLDWLYIIVGVPVAAGDANPASLPAITRVDVFSPYVPEGSRYLSSTYTGALNAVYCGELSSGGSNAYVECGFAGVANNSNSFVNWAAAAAGLGLTPEHFALFSYDLSPVEALSAKGLYDVTFSASLPLGTIEVAYGCATGASEACALTPFTEAGQVTPIPEPAGLLLVAAGGLMLAIFRRRLARQASPREGNKREEKFSGNSV